MIEPIKDIPFVETDINGQRLKSYISTEGVAVIVQKINEIINHLNDNEKPTQ
jgi:hypothetical protein